MVPAPPVIALSDIADGDAAVTANAACRMIDELRRFGDRDVANCGWIDKNRPDAIVLPELVAGRACARTALANQAPFVLVWRVAAGDPICNDMALSTGVADAHCGFMRVVQTRALVGLRKAKGYTVYEITTEETTSQDDWIGSDQPPEQRTSRTTALRCSEVESPDNRDDLSLEVGLACIAVSDDAFAAERSLCNQED